MLFNDSRKSIILLSTVILACLAVSIISSVFLFRYSKEQNEIRIERYFEDRAEKLQLGINNILQMLDAVAGLFHSVETIDKSQFDRFVTANLANQSSIISLAWIPYITNDDRKQFEAGLSGQGMRGHYIYDHNSHGLTSIAFNQDTYYPVKYLYSRIDTLLFPGLNLGTQYKTRKKLQESAASNSILVTNGIRLQRGEPGLITVRAFKPVYQYTSAQQQEIKGFVLAQIDVESLMSSTFGQEDNLSILLFDINAQPDEQLLFDNKHENNRIEDIRNINQLSSLKEPYWTRYYNVGDRKWLISFIEDPDFGNQTAWLPFLGLLTGLGFTTFLLIYMLVAWSRTQEVKQLKEESDAKTRFLQAIGHDLRQPLNIIGLYLSRLEQNKHTSLDEEGRTLINNIRDTLRGLHNMFTSLLDITRLDAGMIQPEFCNVELLPLITDLGDEFDLLAAQKGLELRVRCQDISIVTDPILLERILRNLLSNAIKYTDRGRILLGVRKLKDSVRIYIADTGRGIDETDIETVLQPYQRGERTGDVDGLGLGLAIVKQTADILKLDLVISSKQGIGTHVIISTRARHKS